MEPTKKNIANLKSLLDFVEKILTTTQGKDEYDWFIQDFGGRFSKYFVREEKHSPHISAEGLGQIGVNVDWIISYLRMDVPVKQLADFSFINEKYAKVRQQLEIDNVQMWRARYGKNSMQGSIDFDEFCRFAHYQLEELLNFYFFLYEELRPDEIKELWIKHAASVPVDSSDSSYYKNKSSFREGKTFVFYKQLIENAHIKHKTKYYSVAGSSYKPFGPDLNNSYSSKRNLFNQIHFFNEDLPKEKRLGSFKYAEYIGWYRNELSHRFSVTDEKRAISDDKKQEYDDFVNSKNFDAVINCLNECIHRVREEVLAFVTVKSELLTPA